jgi:hypothetical protein
VIFICEFGGANIAHHYTQHDFGVSIEIFNGMPGDPQ